MNYRLVPTADKQWVIKAGNVTVSGQLATRAIADKLRVQLTNTDAVISLPTVKRNKGLIINF